MSIVKDIHGCLIPVLTNQDFLHLTNPKLKSEVATWLTGLTDKYNLTPLTKSSSLGGDVFLNQENINRLKVFLKPEMVKRIQLSKANILAYDSNIFDAESASVNWDFSSGVYHIIKRMFLMQTIIPVKGGTPILVLNVGEMGNLLKVGVDHPQYLDRIIRHEIVHCEQIARKELYSLNGKLYFKDNEIKAFDKENTKENILEYQLNLPYEIEAYTTQLEGLFTDYTEVFDIMNNIKR